MDCDEDAESVTVEIFGEIWRRAYLFNPAETTEIGFVRSICARVIFRHKAVGSSKKFKSRHPLYSQNSFDLADVEASTRPWICYFVLVLSNFPADVRLIGLRLRAYRCLIVVCLWQQFAGLVHAVSNSAEKEVSRKNGIYQR